MFRIQVDIGCTQCDERLFFDIERSEIMDGAPKDDPLEGWDLSTDEIRCPKCNPDYEGES